MVRQPKTRLPKAKFAQVTKVLCRVCGEEKFLYATKTGPTWQCPANINH